MSEQQPTGLPSEEAKEKDRPRTPEEEAKYIEDMLAEVAKRYGGLDPEEILPGERADWSIEIAHLEDMMVAFEAAYSLEALHAIVDLDPNDAPNHPLRAPARQALFPIVELLNQIEDGGSTITSEQLSALKAKYMRLSQAVGIINNKKVDHTRTTR